MWKAPNWKAICADEAVSICKGNIANTANKWCSDKKLSGGELNSMWRIGPAPESQHPSQIVQTQGLHLGQLTARLIAVGSMEMATASKSTY